MTVLPNTPLPSQPGRDYYQGIGSEMGRGISADTLIDAGHVSPLTEAVAGRSVVATQVESNEVETGPTVEDRFIERFHWVPYRKSEASLALVGLEPAVNRASRSSRGLKAVEEVVSSARRCKTQAAMSMNSLELALKDQTKPESLDPREITAIPEVMQALAIHQLFASSLVAQRWPIKTGIDKKLRPIINGFMTMDGVGLVNLWGGAYSSARDRYTYWDDQESLVVNHPRVLEADREARHRLIRR